MDVLKNSLGILSHKLRLVLNFEEFSINNVFRWWWPVKNDNDRRRREERGLLDRHNERGLGSCYDS